MHLKKYIQWVYKYMVAHIFWADIPVLSEFDFVELEITYPAISTSRDTAKKRENKLKMKKVA